MPIEIKIPGLGESITEVQIAEWLKAEGDLVKKDENIAVIDSEKSTLELPSPENGRLIKILHAAGDTVKIGTTVAQIEIGDLAKNGEAKTEKNSAPKKDEAKKEETKTADPKKEKVPAENNSPEPKKDSSEKSEASVEEIKPEKEISAPKSKPFLPGREEEVVPMTMLRRTAAKRLVEAKQQMAMLTTFNEIDMSAAQGLRKEHQENFEKRYQVRLGFMSFFVKAAIDALKQFPQLNAEIRGNEIVYRNYFDIGVAIASERGLVVPVLRDAGRMGFADIEKNIGDFSRRAKDGKLKPEELQNGTFTITNGGVFGSLFSTPIINPPQTGILGMHSIQERPIALQGQVVIRPMMYVALSYDHRIVDGREAVLFLHRIKEVIEKPARMLIEI
jgi:2-oxoglutarate dehydrogenase E2 component (dihydrolipoamide succinyltransferase)